MASSFMLIAMVAMKMLLPMEDGNYSAGVSLPGEMELYHRVHEELPSQMGANKDLVQLFVPSMMISHVMVKDLYANNSGLAQIVHGGIGKNSIGIQLTSQLGSGFSFDVAIYGFKVGEKNEAFGGKIDYFEHKLD